MFLNQVFSAMVVGMLKYPRYRSEKDKDEA